VIVSEHCNVYGSSRRLWRDDRRWQLMWLRSVASCAACVAWRACRWLRWDFEVFVVMWINYLCVH